jgi:aspartyl-tRNA(Asn)/glutamyl-tRNA(Gln) amidotransferase subunit A
MSTALIYSDATKLAELIRTREISPVEVIKAHLDRIDAVTPKVNAIVTIADRAREMNSVPCTVCHSRRRIRSTPQRC